MNKNEPIKVNLIQLDNKDFKLVYSETTSVVLRERIIKKNGVCKFKKIGKMCRTLYDNGYTQWTSPTDFNYEASQPDIMLSRALKLIGIDCDEDTFKSTKES